MRIRTKEEYIRKYRKRVENRREKRNVSLNVLLGDSSIGADVKGPGAYRIVDGKEKMIAEQRERFSLMWLADIRTKLRRGMQGA